MDPKKRAEIIKALDERGVRLPCPRCGNHSFTIIDGFFNETIQATTNSINIGGRTIPSVITVCNKCGYLSQHAIGVLGLLPKDVPKKEEEKVNG